MASDITTHYAKAGNPVERIREVLERSGVNMATLDEAQLSAVDEFHIRGRKATLELTAKLHPQPDWRVLDIGSGLGGPARTMAVKYGCQVTGIDLTPSYVAAANTLSSWIHRRHQAHFIAGDATALPFGNATFDAAMSFHVAMNHPVQSQDVCRGPSRAETRRAVRDL